MIIADSNIQAVDMDMAKRFAWFRNEYVSPKQIEASKMINCSQGKLSEIEAGKRKIDYKTIRTLSIKFKLNTEWLATGDGNPVTLAKEEESGENKLLKQLQKENIKIQAELLSMEKSIIMLEKNQEFFLKKIEAFLKFQETTVNSMQKEIDLLKKVKS